MARWTNSNRYELIEKAIMAEEQFLAWLDELVDSHPEVIKVWLMGSRDVVIKLDDSCYQIKKVKSEEVDSLWPGMIYTIAEQRDRQELKLALAISRPALDVFFLRPDGSIHRYLYQAHIYDELLAGQYKSLKMCGWALAMADGDEKLAAESVLDGAFEGDFTRLLKELWRANELFTREAQDG